MKRHADGQIRTRYYGGYRIINRVFRLLGMRFGWTSDVVGRAECPYLRRHILWLGVLTLRLHKFLRSDNDQALHDHPWWFVTFPLRTYTELVPFWFGEKVVRGWRFHFRPASYRHAVFIDEPCWTVVLTGPKIHTWGFWTVDGRVPLEKMPPPPCVDPEDNHAAQ